MPPDQLLKPTTDYNWLAIVAVEALSTFVLHAHRCSPFYMILFCYDYEESGFPSQTARPITIIITLCVL